MRLGALCCSVSLVLLFAFSVSAQNTQDVNGADSLRSNAEPIAVLQQLLNYSPPPPANDNSILNESILATSVVDLFDWMLQNTENSRENSPKVQKYNRRQHFGGWVKQDGNVGCKNTRATVLERDANLKRSLEYDKAGCLVLKGHWDDPYTQSTFTDTADLQIDHVVPLKNAYYAGAYSWDATQRCNYANFIANDYHLLTVSGHENMKKGDKSPDKYIPPNADYTCEYLKDWMKIKAIWELKVTPDEADAIRSISVKSGCVAKDRKISVSEFGTQRNKSGEILQACIDHPPGTGEY